MNWTQLLSDATTSSTSWMTPSTEEVAAEVTFGSYYGPLQNDIMKSTDLNYVDISYPTTKSAPYLADRSFFANSILVGFQLQIIEGDYNSSDCNEILPDDIPSIFQSTILRYRRAGRPSADRAPGSVVYEETLQVAASDADFDLPSDLLPQSTLKVRSDIPSGVLAEGYKYTARARCILAFPYESDDGYEPRWYVYDNTVRPYYTYWGISRASVNSKPSVVNLTVNGLASAARLLSTDGLTMGFSLKNEDGPKARYRIQVGKMSYGQFVPSMWDTNWVTLSDGIGVVDVTTPYQGRELKNGVSYSWRVRASDGLSSGEWSEVRAFSLNDPPRIKSLKVDDSETLFGQVPKAKADGAVVTWVYYDKESVAQKYYKLYYRQEDEGTETLISGKGATASVTLPTLTAGKQVFLRLIVSDGVEETQATGSYISNSSATVTSILVEGQENPVDVTSLTPTISWVYQDADSEAQAGYHIQVGTTPDFTTLMWNRIRYHSVNSVVYDGSALSHGTYFIRMRAYDGVSWSEFSDSITAFFAINNAPTAPTLLLPTAGSYDGAIEVRWTGSSDADGDTLTYHVEVTNRQSADRGWELLVGPLPSTQTSYWIGANDLPSGNDYGVRVIASDGIASSSPSTSQKFTIANHAPTSPVFATPTSAQVVRKSLTVEWIESDPVDVDGDVVTYTLEISDDSSTSSPTWTHVASIGAGTSSYVLDVSQYDNGSDYRLRITATDEHGLMGDRSLSPKFTVDSTSIANDVSFMDGTTYITTSDGRILRLRDAIWQVDEDWSGERLPRDFDYYSTPGGQLEVADGEIRFITPAGETMILREGE